MVGLLEPQDFGAAIAILVRRGWNQGGSYGSGGAVCAARALNIAVATRTNGCWAPSNEARKWLGLYGMTIPQWNDLASTSFEDVVARFARAAARMNEAREQGQA
jgi:hypothetical protein